MINLTITIICSAIDISRDSSIRTMKNLSPISSFYHFVNLYGIRSFWIMWEVIWVLCGHNSSNASFNSKFLFLNHSSISKKFHLFKEDWDSSCPQNARPCEIGNLAINEFHSVLLYSACVCDFLVVRPRLYVQNWSEPKK
jgi:hypothetical protein